MFNAKIRGNDKTESARVFMLLKLCYHMNVSLFLQVKLEKLHFLICETSDSH